MLSHFRTRLMEACAWDGLLERINEQIQAHNITVTKGCHVDASITQSPRKPKTKPPYEVVNDRDDEDDAKTTIRVIEVVQPGVDAEARWVKKGGQSIFGYKQHTMVDGNGLVLGSVDISHR